MTLTKTTEPWQREPKVAGQTTPTVTWRLDPIYRQVLEELARSETERLGAKISMPTIITNLSTRNGNAMDAMRTRLRARYLQLKRERTDGQRQGGPTAD